MTRDELLKHLTSIEWDNFEVKEAQSELPKNIWETVSAFANTSGGWIVLGFRYTKLAENAGYGMNKVLSWRKLTGEEVLFDSNLTRATVAYVRNIEEDEPQNEPQSEINALQNGTNVPQNEINVPQNEPQNGTNVPQNKINVPKSNLNVPQKRRMSQAYRRQRLLDMMIFNERLTKQELSDIMGVNEITIQRDLTELRKHHRIVWVGSSKKGHWEIDK